MEQVRNASLDENFSFGDMFNSPINLQQVTIQYRNDNDERTQVGFGWERLLKNKY